jgi:hypothetical protein
MSTGIRTNKLHVTVHLAESSCAEVGKAIGILLRKYLTPELIVCEIKRTNDTRLSRRAESVLCHFLERPRVSVSANAGASARTRKIVLNDAQVERLAKEWDRSIEDYAVVVPHMFYLPLLRLFLRNMEQQAPEIRKKVRFFFDYAQLEGIHELVRQCFIGERAQVLRHLRNVGAPYIDCGRRLLLENLISLACYSIPCRYLVFVDDDFFLRDQNAVQRLLDPLQSGYVLTGIFVKRVQRIHTCLFAMRPEYLRNRLALFDDGTNLYPEDLRSTGSITYKALAKRKKGVFPVADFDDYEGLGKHLGHCAGELWGDLPLILHRLIPYGDLPEGVGRLRLDVPVLLESLAEAFQVSCPAAEYKIIGNDLRMNAHKQFPDYLEKLYGNHRWLIANAGAC